MCTFHSHHSSSKVNFNQRGLGSWATTCLSPHNPLRTPDAFYPIHRFKGMQRSADSGLAREGSRSLACRLLHTPEGPMNHFRWRDIGFSPTGIS
jgi:hypothetical protein